MKTKTREFVPINLPSCQPGREYQKLTVLSTHKLKGTYRYFALCQCSCGSEPKYIRIDGLVNGMVEGCGCVQKKSVTKHGCFNSKIYKTWSNMMRRCYDPKNNRFSRYGGRGITVCDSWHDPKNFIDDMEKEYMDGQQIERKDNDAGYSNENCVWANKTEQANNKSSNVSITHDGKTLTQRKWAEELGISEKLISYRIKTLHWDPVRALTEPINSIDESCCRARKNNSRIHAGLRVKNNS